MLKNNNLDFSNQDIYVGLDVHKKSWHVSIYTKEFEHKTFSQNPEPQLLVNYLNRNFPHANYNCVYEAGYCGFWIHDFLTKSGINCIVVNPADVPTKDKEKRMKTDRIDSRKLAKSLRSKELDSIYVPERRAIEDRSLMRARHQAVKQQTRFKNQIKGMLNFYGIAIPDQFNAGNWSGSFINWLEEISMENHSGKEALEFYLDELKHYRKQIAHLNRKVKELSKTDNYQNAVPYLVSIPGIGIISAMILLTELVDINRFKTLDHLASFIGLIPGERSSGDKEIKTGVIHRGNSYLRNILIESSWIAVRKDPALMMCYKELTKRMCGQKAIIRIAKKLLSRIRYVLKNNKFYSLAVIK